jgi:hypothetical protein
MSHRPSGLVVTFLFCLLSLIATARTAIAKVTRIEFTSKQPYGTFSDRRLRDLAWQDPGRPIAPGDYPYFSPTAQQVSERNR